MSTLLDKAKSIKVVRRGNHEYTTEEKELAVAWANDEIITVQVMKAMGHKQLSVTYTFLAHMLKTMYKTRWQK